MRISDWSSDVCSSDLDGFHTLTLHRSLMEGGIMGGTSESIYDNAPGMYGVDIGTEQGHTLRCLDAAQTFKMFADVSFAGKSVEERLHLLPPPGVTQGRIPQLFKSLSPRPVEQLATGQIGEAAGRERGSQ